MPAPPNLTPEQIAKAEQRRAAKLAKKAALANGTAELSEEQKMEQERRRFLKRDWVNLGGGEGVREGKKSARILTWNLLAQTLVRRELFPGSDCLKWSDRKPLLLGEMEHHASCDIICLQECDKLKDLLAVLPNHSHVQGCGPGKLHGLVIIYRTDRFAVRASHLLQLDLGEVNPVSQATGSEAAADEEGADGRRRRGGSRQTKNVGLIVALERADEPGKGVVVATTHLFWHPKYAYERVRQSLILVRTIRQFQKDNNCTDWPVVFAGDLNTQPSEATYQLLVAPHKPLAPSLVAEVESSRFVHESLFKVAAALLPTEPAPSEPPSVSGTGTNTPTTSTPAPTSTPARKEKERDDEEEELPDSNEKSLKGTRPPTAADGLPTVPELVQLYQEVMPRGGARSAYGSAAWAEGRTGESFDARGGFAEGMEVEGRGEPAYTCFTPLFRLTLDYLLLLPPLGETDAEITGVLMPPKIEELGVGLPRKGICASDHLAVGCEITW
ncbi:hypothetical protein IAT38_004668 [Cryptococcus sp. DSM 104549]